MGWRWLQAFSKAGSIKSSMSRSLEIRTGTYDRYSVASLVPTSPCPTFRANALATSPMINRGASNVRSLCKIAFALSLSTSSVNHLTTTLASTMRSLTQDPHEFLQASAKAEPCHIAPQTFRITQPSQPASTVDFAREG